MAEEMEKAAGTKYDANKPRLELLPPSYWVQSNSYRSHKMASWYFYGDKFPGPVGWDGVPILEYGCIKYNSHNWFKGMRWGRLVGAFHRHCNKWDEDLCLWVPRDLSDLDEGGGDDPGSGQEHGKHAECCRIFLGEYYAAFQHGILIGENDCAWYVNSMK